MAKKGGILHALLRKKKKTIKPTRKEQKIITGRLQHKYPQMYEHAVTKVEKKQLSRAAPGDRKALLKMIGKRLKEKYRKK